MDRNKPLASKLIIGYTVALRKESVDRNNTESVSFRACTVALRKESVDRNNAVQIKIVKMHVALRKESVDRNKTLIILMKEFDVALRKESVDRNCHNLNLPSSPIESLSARRAWIEIYKYSIPY